MKNIGKKFPPHGRWVSQFPPLPDGIGREADFAVADMLVDIGDAAIVWPIIEAIDDQLRKETI